MAVNLSVIASDLDHPEGVAWSPRGWLAAGGEAGQIYAIDPAARAATSGFARTDPAVVDRVVAQLRVDLESGAWDARHGDLRRLDAYDAGLRLVVSPG